MATTMSYTPTNLTKLPNIQTWSHHNNTSSNLSFPISQTTPFIHLRFRKHTRQWRSTIVTRAGPTSGQFIFAFAFPLSLLLITAFAAFRVAVQLDQKFLEELAMNEALREEEEEDDELTGVVTPRKEEPALPQSRNRPRREI